MKKKRLYNRVVGGVLAFLMIISLGLSPVTSQVVWAESDITISEEKDGDVETTNEKGSAADEADTDEKGSVVDEADTEESAADKADTEESAVTGGETTTTIGAESSGNKARTATTDSGLEIVLAENVGDLEFEENESYDIASYFTIHYNGNMPYVIWDDDQGWVYYNNFSALFKISYCRVVGGKEVELYSKPSKAGTYKAYVEFSATTYWVYEDANSNGPEVNVNGDEKGSIQFTIKGEENLTAFKGLQLVYGDKDLDDKKAFILLMFGDGFDADEQEKFYVKAEETADYIMNTSPYDEFKDVIKIYAYGTVSDESGARGETANSLEEALADKKNTYFGSSFWTGGMERLLSVGTKGQAEIEQLKKAECEEADFSVVIVNSTKYGGSGGDVCVASLNTSALEMMLHELGHTVANLADEYWAGGDYAQELVNMTQESDPENVKWSRFVGKNGIGVYKYNQNETEADWYRPSENCKMQYLSQDSPFCEVCKEALRIAFCEHSNVTKMFFQTYADEFHEPLEAPVDGQGKDMSEYFILRKGGVEKTGKELQELGEDFTLKYYVGEEVNEDNLLEKAPYERGIYTIKATFGGNEDFDEIELIVTYEIELPDLITIEGVADKVYDGNPVEPTISIDETYTEPYTTNVYYTGLVQDAYGYRISYEDTEDKTISPVKPGQYTVNVELYNGDTLISKKSKSYKISLKTTSLLNNNTGTYPGAQEWYNNKHIIIVGEGFTSEEQDKFEELAKEYVDYILNTEPFKETQLYFNFTSIETVSNETGVNEDTYFGITCDENGNITYANSGAVSNISYNNVSQNYKANIVIVNDENVKGAVESDDYRGFIYGGTSDSSKEYVAKELLNYLTGHEEGYRPSNDKEEATQRIELLDALYYTWYGVDYAIVVSRAYDVTFVENGSPIELDDYFQTYVGKREVSKSDLDYKITYYDSNGNKLDGDEAPSKAGTYTAIAELIPSGDERYACDMDGEVVWKLDENDVVDDNEYVLDKDGNKIGYLVTDPVTEVEVEGITYHIARSRGKTSFTIQPASTSGGSGNTDDSGNASGSGNTGNSDNTSDSGNVNGTSNATSDSESAAKTGDTAPWALYLVLLAGAAVVGGAVVVKRRRR